MEGSAASVPLEDMERFRAEAAEELSREKKMLEAINQPRNGFTVGWIIAFIILAVACIEILLVPDGVMFWIVIAFILYSFNFIIWFIPTSRNKGDSTEKEKLKLSGKTVKGPVRYLLKKKKALGVEIGLTMFLSGMVPLALSFFILFGIGVVFASYFAFVRHLYDQNDVLTIIIQIFIILVFFVVLVMIKPQARGIGQTARTLKGKYGSARSRGKVAGLFIIAVIGVIVAVIGLLFVGAILRPGGTWQEIVDFLKADGSYNLLTIILVLIAEVVIMRHFQAVSGKRMARTLLEQRIQGLQDGTIAPLDAALAQANKATSTKVDLKVLDDAKTIFYSIVIYDIFEHNIFGYSPVYVVGPKMSVVMNEDALAHIN
jgi:hypothetical protein